MLSSGRTSENERSSHSAGTMSLWSVQKANAVKKTYKIEEILRQQKVTNWKISSLWHD